MTTSLRICATTRRAQAGDAGTRCGPVTPSAATVQTSILRSSACCGLTGFLPASTSAFHCPKTRTKEISPVITAGLSSMPAKPAGSPVTSQRRGKRSRKKIISSAALTPIACSYPPAATSHCLHKQGGPALNYFVYPYVEIDGKPYEKLDKQFS